MAACIHEENINYKKRKVSEKNEDFSLVKVEQNGKPQIKRARAPY